MDYTKYFNLSITDLALFGGGVGVVSYLVDRFYIGKTSRLRDYIMVGAIGATVAAVKPTLDTVIGSHTRPYVGMTVVRPIIPNSEMPKVMPAVRGSQLR
jgi:hypothetical protein